MKNYILVHGAWGGAWEFSDLINLLTQDDVKVTAVDLPGHGKNARAIPDVTMAAYVQTVVDTINKQNEKVILVGHSLAGAVVSQVAEQIPEKIDRLIYVAAILPKNGQSPMDLMSSDEQGQLLPNVTFSEDQTYATLTEEVVRNVLLNDFQQGEALDRIIPHFLFKQATEPFMAAAQLTEGRFGAVKKYYIRAGDDKVLSPNLQGRMLESWEMDEILALPSGHFPLNTMPKDLYDLIRKVS